MKVRTWLTLALLSWAVAAKKCNQFLLQSYLLEGNDRATEVANPMCHSVKANCCTPTDMLKIYSDAASKLEPALANFGRKVKEALAGLRRLNEKVGKTVFPPLGNERKKAICEDARGKFRSFDFDALARNLFVGAEKAATTFRDFHYSFFCMLCDQAAHKHVDVANQKVSVDSSVCMTQLAKNKSFVQLMNVDLVAYYSAVQNYLDCEVFDKFVDFPFLWEEKAAASDSVRQCLAAMKDASNEILPPCLPLCNTMRISGISPGFEGDFIFINKANAYFNAVVDLINDRMARSEDANPLKDIQLLQDATDDIKVSPAPGAAAANSTAAAAPAPAPAPAAPAAPKPAQLKRRRKLLFEDLDQQGRQARRPRDFDAEQPEEEDEPAEPAFSMEPRLSRFRFLAETAAEARPLDEASLHELFEDDLRTVLNDSAALGDLPSLEPGRLLQASGGKVQISLPKPSAGDMGAMRKRYEDIAFFFHPQSEEVYKTTVDPANLCAYAKNFLYEQGLNLLSYIDGLNFEVSKEEVLKIIGSDAKPPQTQYHVTALLAAFDPAFNAGVNGDLAAAFKPAVPQSLDFALEKKKFKPAPAADPEPDEALSDELFQAALAKSANSTAALVPAAAQNATAAAPKPARKLVRYKRHRQSKVVVHKLHKRRHSIKRHHNKHSIRRHHKRPSIKRHHKKHLSGRRYGKRSQRRQHKKQRRGSRLLGESGAEFRPGLDDEISV